MSGPTVRIYVLPQQGLLSFCAEICQINMRSHWIPHKTLLSVDMSDT